MKPGLRIGQEALEAKGWWGAHKWLVLRRASQLGILALFLVGPWFGAWVVKGNLNYSLFLSLAAFPELMNVSLSYEKILNGVAASFGPQVSRQGYSDLAIRCRGELRKFSGNAQCRKRGWIMHHGTLLYSREAIRRIPYYLRPPPKEPEYRKGRRHREFMTNVLPVYSRAELMHRVRHGLAREFSAGLRQMLAPALTGLTPFHRE